MELATPTFSIVIPARNEEKLLPFCLNSIVSAAKKSNVSFEIIVVLNRCTDRTEEIAREYKCRIAIEDAKNLSKIRNAGAKIAKGKYLITIDADSIVSENMLEKVEHLLSSNKYIGGGVLIIPQRLSLGIILTWGLLVPIALYYRIFAGLFFCKLCDFHAIGGFDENYVSVEDIDFAKRLKKYGKSQNKKFAMLLSAYIKTSCRKFDRFGDWYFIKNIFESISLLKGKNQKAADKVWYDFKRD